MILTILLLAVVAVWAVSRTGRPGLAPGKAVAREWARYRRNLKAWLFWPVALLAVAALVVLVVTAGGLSLPKVGAGSVPSVGSGSGSGSGPTLPPLPVCDGSTDAPCTPRTNPAQVGTKCAALPLGLSCVAGDTGKVPDAAKTPKVCAAGRAADGSWLPDPGCAPGAISTRVTQANIGSTICQPGYTRKVRPPTSITRPVKVRLLAAYGYAPGLVSELDHVVPLTLGGANSVRNLAPQPGPVPNGKDRVEVLLAQLVCSHRVPLDEAQARIARDWTTALLGLPSVMVLPAGSDLPGSVDLDTDTDQTGEG